MDKYIDMTAPLVQAVTDQDQMTLQILNVVGYIICLTANGLSQSVAEYSLSDITAQWSASIDPSTWAFAIWGVIYSLLGMFVVYQALPDSMVPDRNNELIFEDIGYVFLINMLLNGIWLVIFQTNSVIGFTVGALVIAGILSTDLFMMMKSTRTPVNMYEWISMRGGFSIYSGWVSAATILNISYMLKSWGLVDGSIFWGLDEETLGVVVLYVAWIIYNVAAYSERNPLYGSVLIYVIYAIYDNIVTNKSYYTLLETNTMIILVLQIISMSGLTAYLGYEELVLGSNPFFEDWDSGLFY